MVEVSVVTLPRNTGAYPAARAVLPSADLNVVTRESSPLALSEARRAGNRDRIGLVSDLRCECMRPRCRRTVPAVAETYRTLPDQFVVAPNDFVGGLVVKAADRFFIVELHGQAIRLEER
jgi:hypothetical protein